MSYTLHCGDALAVLRTLPSEHFDGCLCDPPYALGETRSPRSATPRKSSRDSARGGFMGMRWDAEIPGADVWTELLRVLQPGSYVLAFGGSRTFHRLACAIEDGGFTLRDCLIWLHAQGFPKSRSCLKPAWEPIILARKPGPLLPLNVDAARLPVADRQSYAANSSGDRGHAQNRTRRSSFAMGAGRASDIGRWPPNVLLDEHAAAALDLQAGIRASGANPNRRRSNKFANTYGDFVGQEHCVPARGSDSGPASRFFFCAKAGRDERQRNPHPTIKPVALTEHLALLILPNQAASQKLIIPYCGSGSEVIGALHAGWSDVVGIDRDKRYLNVARRRIEASIGSPEEGARGRNPAGVSSSPSAQHHPEETV